MRLPVAAAAVAVLALASACGEDGDPDLPHGEPIDQAGPGGAIDFAGADLTGVDLAGFGGDMGAAPSQTIKLSTALYCPKMGSFTPRLFYLDTPAAEAAWDAQLAALVAGGGAYALGPLDVLGTRVRTGMTGGGSTVTPGQLENMKISCGHINSKAGPGAFETTTLVADPTGKPSCLFEGMDWGIDFHYSSASFPMRAVCLGAPTSFAWTKNFANDAFPTALAAPASGVGAYVAGGKTYAVGYSQGTWASGGGTVDANKTTTYKMTFTATNAIGSMSTPQLGYRFVNIGDTAGGGGGGIAKHPMDNNCLVKSAGEKGNNVEGQLGIKNGQVWAIRVMLAPPPDGSVPGFQWVLWADTEFAIGPNIQPYAVISDLPCEFDQIVDGCYSDDIVTSYYPGSPQYLNDVAAAKAAGKRYCGVHTDQVYYMNVRSQSWLSATPSDDCAAGSTCTFGAFFKSSGP
jgi:hypothetical protein